MDYKRELLSGDLQVVLVVPGGMQSYENGEHLEKRINKKKSQLGNYCLSG